MPLDVVREVDILQTVHGSLTAKGRGLNPMILGFDDEGNRTFACQIRAYNEGEDKARAFIEALSLLITTWSQDVLFCMDSYFTLPSRDEVERYGMIAPSQDPDRMEAIQAFHMRRGEDFGTVYPRPYLRANDGRLFFVSLHTEPMTTSDGFLYQCIRDTFADEKDRLGFADLKIHCHVLRELGHHILVGEELERWTGV